MASQLRVHPQTVEDLSSSTAYFDEISDRVGKRFRDAIRDRLHAIAERPESFARVHDQQRAALVNGFPYVILFEYSDSFVTVLGVFHAASDQSGWFTRSV
ncbi:MAG: type II toxin-antitoxin system RelE/ParE family toxin [Planctomycetales bacterium]|nr:type II toxin-antitoxin system RelE/ParE family toxin [Planctomycetales bacterium]